MPTRPVSQAVAITSVRKSSPLKPVAHATNVYANVTTMRPRKSASEHCTFHEREGGEPVRVPPEAEVGRHGAVLEGNSLGLKRGIHPQHFSKEAEQLAAHDHLVDRVI